MTEIIVHRATTNSCENCIEGIKVHMITMIEKDPNDLGYEKFTDIKDLT